MWSDSATPDRRGNRGARGNGECMRRVERGGRLMVSVTPSGFPVCDGSVYRGSAAAPPPACGLATPTGFTRPDERTNANSTRGQTPLRREGKRRFDERTNATSTRGQSSIPASPERATDHRQAVKPARAQPLHNGNIQLTEALKGRQTTGRGESLGEATEYRQGRNP